MIKHTNNERATIYLGILILILLPNIYFFISQILNYISTIDHNPYIFLFEISVHFLILLFFTNFMLHMVMESFFTVQNKDDKFQYSSLLRRKELIPFKRISKIIICKESLVGKGDYESIIVIRKGFRRSLFFQEYSMRKQDYIDLKSVLLSKEYVRIVRAKKAYTKGLAALFLL